MPSCWHDMLFLFCLLLFYLLLPSMGWLCGVGVFGLIEWSHSLPALHSGLQIIIIIIIIIIFSFLSSMGWLCGVGVVGFIERSLNPDLALLIQF